MEYLGQIMKFAKYQWCFAQKNNQKWSKLIKIIQKLMISRSGSVDKYDKSKGMPPSQPVWARS